MPNRQITGAAIVLRHWLSAVERFRFCLTVKGIADDRRNLKFELVAIIYQVSLIAWAQPIGIFTRLALPVPIGDVAAATCGKQEIGIAFFGNMRRVIA